MILPPAALSQHIAVLGKTGSGKTYAAKGIIEQLLDDKKRVGIIDPTGAWFGLRSSRDGKGPGFSILVLGGDHGDLPLPSAGGAAVARLLVEQGVNLVADTSTLTVGERTRWFIDFATTLHRLNRQPLHLVIDEAHMFAPQGKVPDPDTGKMLHACNTLASGGRSRGFRLTMITQRPQKLHKDALTSADTLIAMRVLAPQDRLAVEDWIKGCGDIAMGKEVLNSLASLPRGTGWVWYPEGTHLKLTKFPPIKTFDSSATPTDGHALAQPKGAAEINLDEIKAALTDAVKEAEANDPKLLRKKIAELERDTKKTAGPAADKEALKDEYDRGRADGAEDTMVMFVRFGYPLQDVKKALDTACDEFNKLCATEVPRRQQSDRRDHYEDRPGKTMREATNRRAPGESAFDELARDFKNVSYKSAAVANGSLPAGERAILIACAQHQPDGCTREQLTILTGYKRSTRNAYIQRLNERGYLHLTGEQVCANLDGMNALGSDFRPLPTGAALRDYWLGRLPEGERKVFQVVIDAYPEDVSREAISGETRYKRSTRNAYIQRLTTRQLVAPIGDGVRAREELFS